MSSPTWSKLMNAYEKHQRARGLVNGTIRLHRYRLFDLEAATRGGPASVTTDLLVEMLSVPTWKPNTRKSVRTVYRSFFSWAHRYAGLPSNPADDLPPVKVPMGLPRPTPDPVLQQALRLAEPREHFMILLGACAGLRACEIALVHSDHWEPHRGILTVVGKGGKTRRLAPRDPGLVRMLDQLEEYAFPNRWTGLPITSGHVTKLLSTALAETYTGHTLRHRFATTGLRNTKNLLAVSRALGHSRLDTTQIYTLLEDDDLIELGEATAA